ncbi:MAG: inorganic phosphate transporter [Ignavibacteriae bacterium]|nr:inorganic phosphate transporter [Ignavibacteriota bacterium]
MNIQILLVVLVGILSYANGANDISKGIATLVGSGVSDFKRALLWGTLWTTAGTLVAARLSTAMMKTFAAGMTLSNIPIMVVMLSVVTGASMWVWFATRTGLPVSTTHAITGSMIGVIIFSVGFTPSAPLPSLVMKIITPLLLSPIVAFALAFAANRLFRRRLEKLNASCVCMTKQPLALVPVFAIQTTSNNTLVQGMSMQDVPAQLTPIHGTVEECSTSSSVVAKLRILDTAHYVSAGLTSFARGLNDAPKIIPFLLLAPAINVIPLQGYIYIGIAMALGGLVSGLRVIRTLSERITSLSHTDGFLANVITSSLVGLGAWFGLPMSTTHVSTSAIVGAGVSQKKTVSRKVIREIATAWIVTLPMSAFIAVISAIVLQYFIS